MKEIKIMVRADFAGDVALWIFFVIYIYTFPYICIFIIIALLPLWASSRLLASRVSTSGLRSGAYIFGSSVTPRGSPLRILPSLGARKPPSSLVPRRCSAASFSSSSSSLRGSPPLSRLRRTTQPSLRFSTVFRALFTSAL